MKKTHTRATGDTPLQSKHMDQSIAADRRIDAPGMLGQRVGQELQCRLRVRELERALRGAVLDRDREDPEGLKGGWEPFLS